jgi:hypothetical protein
MTAVKLVTPKGTDPNITPVAQVMTATQALPYTSAAVWSPALVTMELVGYASGNFTNGYLAGFGTNFIQTNNAPTTLRDKKFTVTGWLTGRGSATPAQSLTLISILDYATVVAAATDPTDAEKFALSVERFVAPTGNNAVTSNLTLPTLATFATITWTSDTPSVISNTGVVTRPLSGQPDATVKLSYVLTVGSNSTLPIEITYVVKAAEAIPVVTLFTNDFGTVAKTGYAAGNIVYTPTGGTEITALKDRVQINLSSAAPHTSKGVFAVFAPISTFKVSFLDVDFSTLTGAGKLELEYSVWNAGTLANLKNTALITSAQLKLQKFDGTNWIDEGSALNVITNASDTEYKKTSFSLSGAAKYRLVYTIEGTANTTNTAFALTVDNLVVTDK